MVERSGADDAAIRRIGVREFRGNMASFLRQAREGSTFLVTSRDEILAEIGPPSKPVRQPGALRGRVRMPVDFDVLPLDVIAAMEDGDG